MRISVILAHPYNKSFNHAIAGAVASELKEIGHDVLYHDLYDEGFDAVISANELVSDSSDDALINRHKQEIRQAEGIVIVHPNWWGQPPAILKGWVDRVLREDVAYRFEEEDSGGGVPKGLLKAKAACVLNTSNTPSEREQEVFGDPLETLWKNCIFGFCGVSSFKRKNFCVIADSTPDQRKQWLEDTRSIVKQLF